MESIPIGTTEVYEQDFKILAEDRRKHMAIFGKSGVGKTTLLRNMIAWDIHSGLGVTVIDPHGSLIQEVMGLIPRSRTNDVIYLNPSQPETVLGINVLEKLRADQKPLLVSGLISILKNIWPANWGPRTEYILENATYALLAQPQPVSLAALPQLLTDDKYRRQILEHVTDPAIQNFFRQYDKQNKKLREESISPLLNKVSKFITNPLLRAVIGQTTSSFDFRWLIDSGKILLADLSKGALGEDVSSLLGSLVVTKLSLAALSRQDIPEHERRPHVVVIDEAHAFIHGVDFATILAEARKYRLALTIATQTMAQLGERNLSAVFGNCATIMSYRVSGEDAAVLKREFATILPADQLQDLPDFKFYVRTLSGGNPSGPHLIKAYPPVSGTGKETAREQVIRTSLQRFGRSRPEVEKKINKFLTH